MRRRLFLLLPLVGLAACAPPPHATVSPPPGGKEIVHSPERVSAPSAAESPTPASPTPVATEIVRAARARLGSPYRFGGQGPRGYDCSGLVRVAYAEAGISLPRTAAQQARVGRLLEPSEFEPGDLVLFGQNGRVDHIGIWIGGGRFVHASSRRGVVIDTLETAWFRDRLLGGRRILEAAR